MKSVLMYLLFVWGALVSNNKTELMCNLLHWITGLCFTHLEGCLFTQKLQEYNTFEIFSILPDVTEIIQWVMQLLEGIVTAQAKIHTKKICS